MRVKAIRDPGNHRVVIEMDFREFCRLIGVWRSVYLWLFRRVGQGYDGDVDRP